MKHLLVYLSLLGLVQVLFLASGRAWLNEILGPDVGSKLMTVWLMSTIITLIAVVALYRKLFSDTSKINSMLEEYRYYMAAGVVGLMVLTPIIVLLMALRIDAKAKARRKAKKLKKKLTLESR